MVTNNGEGQPQAGDQGAQSPDGAEKPQPSGAPDGSTGPGAGDTPGATEAPAPRTYSEAEWNDRQSSIDKQVANANDIAARAAMTLHTERAQRAEATAKETDARSVEDGELTQSQADQRSRERVEVFNNTQTREAETQRLSADRQTLEGAARVFYADSLGKQFEVDPQVLLDHPDTQLGRDDGTAMTQIARGLQLDAREAALKAPREEETFDGGGGGGSGAAVDITGMSPRELSILAYGDAETAKRNKAKGR